MARAGLSGAVAALLLALPAAAQTPAPTPAPVTLVVTVEGVRNATGDVRVAICSKARFLSETCEYMGVAKARPGPVSVRIAVPPGTYAAQAFHDEDGDGKIGRNTLGLPTEGLGFSNDAAMRFGPPRFDEAAFQLGPDGGQIHFHLRYAF